MKTILLLAGLFASISVTAAEKLYPLKLPQKLVAKYDCQSGDQLNGYQAAVFQDPDQLARAVVFVGTWRLEGGHFVKMETGLFEGGVSQVAGGILIGSPDRLYMKNDGTSELSFQDHRHQDAPIKCRKLAE